MTLTLSAAEVVALCHIVSDADCTEDDIRAALAAYPGPLSLNDCTSRALPVVTQLAECAKRTGDDGAYLGHSFVLRLVEQSWAKDVVQGGVLRAVPTLLRPPRGLDAQIAAVIGGIGTLLQAIPDGASATALGDRKTFERVCTLRDAFVDASAALDGFAAWKDLHDALHMLQVLGTRWLDPIPSPATTVSVPLPVLLDGLKGVAARTVDGMSPDYLEACSRCLVATLDAERRLATGDVDEQDFAHASLRSMLMRELRGSDAAMFAVSRRFPIRALHMIMPDPVSQQAAVDLCDTIRRRLMEHGQWQATDLRLSAVEQALASPSPALVTQLARGPLPLALFSLRVLLGEDTARRVTAPMRDAVTRYTMSTDPDRPDASTITGSIDEISTTFAALRDAARSAFLKADQALKRDFGRLLALQPCLQMLLARVPAFCALWF